MFAKAFQSKRRRREEAALELTLELEAKKKSPKPAKVFAKRRGREGGAYFLTLSLSGFLLFNTSSLRLWAFEVKAAHFGFSHMFFALPLFSSFSLSICNPLYRRVRLRRSFSLFLLAVSFFFGTSNRPRVTLRIIVR